MKQLSYLYTKCQFYDNKVYCYWPQMCHVCVVWKGCTTSDGLHCTNLCFQLWLFVCLLKWLASPTLMQPLRVCTPKVWGSNNKSCLKMLKKLLGDSKFPIVCKMSCVKKLDRSIWTMEEVNENNLTWWDSSIIRSILRSHIKVIQIARKIM